ncbi:MAG: hypothetical protein ACJ8F7_11445 [Gemmataceae bacterium]
MRRTGLVVAALAVLAGCSDRPRAPSLGDEPEFNNSHEGLRFLAPVGWVLSAKSNLPPDSSPKERSLVMYHSPPTAPPARFEVSRADLPEAADLKAFAAAPSYGSEGVWQPAGEPAAVTVGGRPAARFRFTNQQRVKETTAVRLGERVYFFNTVTTIADEEVRRQLRQTIADVKWTK